MLFQVDKTLGEKIFSLAPSFLWASPFEQRKKGATNGKPKISLVFSNFTFALLRTHSYLSSFSLSCAHIHFERQKKREKRKSFWSSRFNPFTPPERACETISVSSVSPANKKENERGTEGMERENVRLIKKMLENFLLLFYFSHFVKTFKKYMKVSFCFSFSLWINLTTWKVTTIPKFGIYFFSMWTL